MQPTERSYEPVTDEDLCRLARVAMTRHEEMAAMRPDWCSDLVAACLTQGAA